MNAQLVEVNASRVVEVADTGRTGAPVVVFHSGTPTGLVPFDPLVQAASERDLRILTVMRPGYGRSTPKPGRSVADVAADIRQVTAALGIDAYVSVGHSGGGPHALACRSLDASKCRGAITLAGVAPYAVDDLDFLDGMGEDNVAEFGAALAGEDALSAMLSEVAGALGDIQADGIVEAMESLLPDVDRDYLRAGMAEYLAAAFRSGVAAGIAGWRDDDLAFVSGWGFDLADLTNVSIWQGSEDLMVPFAHGQYLANAIPSATAHLRIGDGHLSLLGRSLDGVLDEAVAYLA